MRGEYDLSDVALFGELTPGEAAARLRELDEERLADALEAAEAQRLLHDPHSYDGGWWPFHDRPWQHAGQALGFLPPAAPGSDLLPIFDAGNTEADRSLRGARITINLDIFHLAEIPGRGEHHLLLAFASESRYRERSEALHLSRAINVRETMPAALRGDPVFVGLGAGQEGLSFSFCSVKVFKKEDVILLSQIGTEPFRKGLRLSSQPQPALELYSRLSYGLTKCLAERNALLQKFELNLDFGNSRTGARLAQGAYFVVQVPASAGVAGWDWSDWAFNPESGLLVSALDARAPVRLNYAVFRVQLHEQ